MTEEYQPTLNKNKLTIAPELVVDLANYHGKDTARAAIHEMVDHWLDGYIGKAE